MESAIAKQVAAFMFGAVGQEGVPKHCLPEATGWLVQVETRERTDGDLEWVSVYELRLDHAMNVIGCRRASVRQEAAAAPSAPEAPAPVSAPPVAVTPPNFISETPPYPPVTRLSTSREAPARLPRPLPDRPVPRPPRISYRR
ncbi:MAG TPA: hypothetical protein VLK32_05830 [Bacillota bacterium]|nr:hypothetical protein [Bacillota bacterium]